MTDNSKKNPVSINVTPMELNNTKPTVSEDKNSEIVLDDAGDEEMKKLKEEELILMQKEKKLQERLEKALKSKNEKGADVLKSKEENQGASEDFKMTVLEGLPAEIKLVVQEKFKTMSVIKRPIIMPSVTEDMPKEVTNTETLNQLIENDVKQYEPYAHKSLKPIEVRFLQNQTKPVVDPPTTPVPRASPQIQPIMKTIPQRGQTFSFNHNYNLPKGVPKSFLMQQTAYGAIQPQQSFTPNIPSMPIWLSHSLGFTGNKQNVDQPAEPMNTNQVTTGYTAPQFRNLVYPNNEAINQPTYVQNPQTFSQTAPVYTNNTQMYGQTSSAYTNNTQIYDQTMEPSALNPAPVFVDTNPVLNEKQAYSPSDVYDDVTTETRDRSISPDALNAGQKRLSAFKRLGPLAQAKKPKLTINLTLNTDQPVREVVDETKKFDERYTPVCDRKDIATSTDPIVMKYLVHWPWNNTLTIKKSVSPRMSKSIMMTEAEQMNAYYENDQLFIQVTVTGYPSSWTKEDVLDSLLKNVAEKSFIPCFIEFTQEQCKFLVIRSRLALVNLQKTGLRIVKGDVELIISISALDLKLKNLDFLPRLVLWKRLSLAVDENKLNLKEFTLQSDLSHFIYFPLNRMKNQVDLLQLQGNNFWECLTELNLSHNRLTNITCFDLSSTTPKLKHLDLSYNWFDNVMFLSKCRALHLTSLKLEGNPLCHNYIDPDHYVKVLKLMFSTLKEIDGTRLKLQGEFPENCKFFCNEQAAPVVDKFLQIFFPLLDSSDERGLLKNMYDENAMLTVTYRNKLSFNPKYRYSRFLFLHARNLSDGELDVVKGADSIVKHIEKWPAMKHDPYTFTVDLLHHDETVTIVRVDGLLKLTVETLAEDEQLLAFTRTLVLGTDNSVEYKIYNEMVYWDEPVKEYATKAFQINTVPQKQLSLKLETTPDEYLKEKLIEIFMRITDLEKNSATRCLEMKDWDLKIALEHFMKLTKLDSIDYLLTAKI